MSADKYHPERYWSEVGARIKERENGQNVIAGDDEPYYRYKRRRFLELLHEVTYTGKSVLEIGHGPGGNLLEVWSHQPKRLHGVDISDQMVALARAKISSEIQVQKVNGTALPYADGEFDIVFSATVLQHNTDDEMLRQLMSEMARVSSDQVILYERVEATIKGDDLCLGRPVDYYSSIMQPHGYSLTSTKPINVRASYYVSGAIRKLLNPSSRQEGEPLTDLSVLLQKATLPITSLIDRLWSSEKDVCRIVYRKGAAKGLINHSQRI